MTDTFIDQPGYTRDDYGGEDDIGLLQDGAYPSDEIWKQIGKSRLEVGQQSIRFYCNGMSCISI